MKRNKIITGPYSVETLKRRGVKSTDMACFKGLPDWTPVTQIDFLVDVPVIMPNNTAKSLIKRVFSFLK